MTVTAPKLRRMRPRPPSTGQLRRLEQEISRFIRQHSVPSLRLQAVSRWTDDLLTRLRARWILLRAATAGARQHLALTAHALRRTLNPRPQPHPRPIKPQPKLPQPRPPGAPGPAASETVPIATRATAPSRRDRLESVVVWLCCILIAVGGVLLFAVGRELHKLGDDVVNSHAQVRLLQDRIAKLEKEAQTLRVATSAAAAPVATMSALSLTQDEVNVVRQFIKVLPSQSAGRMTIEPGQPLGRINTAPLPEAIIEQIPRLAGGRFSIDSSGAIIITAAGSNRVDAVVTSAH